MKKLISGGLTGLALMVAACNPPQPAVQKVSTPSYQELRVQEEERARQERERALHQVEDEYHAQLADVLRTFSKGLDEMQVRVDRKNDLSYNAVVSATHTSPDGYLKLRVGNACSEGGPRMSVDTKVSAPLGTYSFGLDISMVASGNDIFVISYTDKAGETVEQSFDRYALDRGEILRVQKFTHGNCNGETAETGFYVSPGWHMTADRRPVLDTWEDAPQYLCKQAPRPPQGAEIELVKAHKAFSERVSGLYDQLHKEVGSCK